MSRLAPNLGDHLAGRIDATPLETAPFDHVYVENLFPPDLYRELRHKDAIQADGTSARREFYLFPEHVALLPAKIRAIWTEVSRATRSSGLQDAFKRKFKMALEGRFERDIDRLNFYVIPILVRDLGGYRISIHDDSGRKAITVQLYLPHDDSQAHLGTRFHEGRDGDAAERVKALKFRPSTAYAFPVVPGKTWHSVARTTPADGARDSLMMTYYVQDHPLDFWKQRSKRYREFAGRFFRD
jgi:hypothetical protein